MVLFTPTVPVPSAPSSGPEVGLAGQRGPLASASAPAQRPPLYLKPNCCCGDTREQRHRVNPLPGTENCLSPLEREREREEEGEGVRERESVCVCKPQFHQILHTLTYTDTTGMYFISHTETQSRTFIDTYSPPSELNTSSLHSYDGQSQKGIHTQTLKPISGTYVLGLCSLSCYTLKCTGISIVALLASTHPYSDHTHGLPDYIYHMVHT